MQKNQNFQQREISGGGCENPAQQFPGRLSCIISLVWLQGLVGDHMTSLLPGDCSPAPAMAPVAEMTVPELSLRVVTQCNYLKDQPLLAPICSMSLTQGAQSCTPAGTLTSATQPFTTPRTIPHSAFPFSHHGSLLTHHSLPLSNHP